MKFINWIGRALSEDGAPSSKRLFTFMFVLTTCYCIIYAVHRQHNLPTYIYYPLLGVILILAGVATLPQVIKLIRGGNDTPEKTEQP